MQKVSPENFLTLPEIVKKLKNFHSLMKSMTMFALMQISSKYCEIANLQTNHRNVWTCDSETLPYFVKFAITKVDFCRDLS